MFVNWDIVGDKIFGILKGSGFRLQMFDKTGKRTIDPHEANRFFATIASNSPELKEFSILVSVHDENANSHVDIKTPNLKDDKDFALIRKIRDSLHRNVGDIENLSINWYKFDHTIRPKDDAYNNIVESKDISKPFGSTKSSYQKIGDSKLIIRHSDIVDEGKVGSRWRHVKAIFIENRIGERFLYPHMHISGARALARHLSNDGTVHDQIGKSIQDLSGDYMSLKKSARMLRNVGDESKIQSLRTSLQEINKQIKKLCGPRGYQTSSPSLMEKSEPNQDLVSQIHADLMERCGCQDDEDAGKTLLVAARYLSEVDCTTSTIEFNRTPDLSSRMSEFTNQRDRLAWQIDELAECIQDDGIRDQLRNMSMRVRDQGAVDPSDLDTIRMVFKANKQIQDAGPEDNELVRIKELSGI
jgi:hypothetical protein